MTIETLRQPKILGFAIFDLAVSFLGIYLLAPILSKLILLIKVDVPRQNWLYLTLPIGIAVHMAVGNITPHDKIFFELARRIPRKNLDYWTFYPRPPGNKIS